MNVDILKDVILESISIIELNGMAGEQYVGECM
jgi:hypothetical protein